jgi:WD40 repeat protein
MDHSLRDSAAAFSPAEGHPIDIDLSSNRTERRISCCHRAASTRVRLVVATGLLLALSRAHAQEFSQAPPESRSVASDDSTVLPELVLNTGGHTSFINGVGFSLEDDLIVTASADSTLRIWDVVTGECLDTLHLPFGPGGVRGAFGFAMSPVADVIAVGGGSNDLEEAVVFLISLEQREIMKSLRRRVTALDGIGVSATAFSPDGNRLAAGQSDGQVVIWNINAAMPETVIRHSSDYISDIDFSPEGDRIVAASHDGSLCVWSIDNGTELARVDIDDGFPTCAAWSRDGDSIVFGTMDAEAPTVSACDRELQNRREILQHEAGFTAIQFSKNGELLVATGAGSTTSDPQVPSFVISYPDGFIQFETRNHLYSSAVCSFSHNAQLFVTAGGENSEVVVVETSSGRTLHTLMGKGRHTCAAGWSREGNRVAWGNDLGTHTLERAFDLEEFLHVDPLASVRTEPQAFDVVIVTKEDAPIMSGPDQLGTFPLESVLQTTEAEENWLWVPNPFRQGGWISKDHVKPAPFADFTNPLDFDLRDTIAEWDQQRRNLTLRRLGEVIGEVNDDRGKIYDFTFLGESYYAAGIEEEIVVVDRASGQPYNSLMGHFGHIAHLAPFPNGRMLVSTSHDQTVRVWSVDEPDPLLSMFFADSEWIVWMPEGYYAASPGGERLMGWQIDNGPDRLASFYPARQFRKTLYRPDVIQELVRTWSLDAALAKAGPLELPEHSGTRPDRGDLVETIQQILPPRIDVLVSPEGRSFRADEVGRITAVVEAQGSPIRKVRLQIDGRPWVQGASDRAYPDGVLQTTETWDVEFLPGDHAVQVIAETDVSDALSEAIEVHVEPTSFDVDLPALYVLAIGVSLYDASETPDLNYADDDAHKILATLREFSAPLYRKVESKVLIDQEATQREILRGLMWIHEQMTERDVGIVFFSGHGDEDEQSIGYLMPTDGKPDELFVSGVSQNQLTQILKGTPGRLILVIDACHAGRAAGDTRSGRGLVPDSRSLLMEVTSDDYGLIVMASSSGREVSRESDQYQLGYFTLALSEALSGLADQNDDGVVFLHETEGYLYERVKELTGGRQHPIVYTPPTLGTFPLAGHPN